MRTAALTNHFQRILANQERIMSKLDATNDAIAQLAAKIDALEMASGGTVTDTHMATLSDVSRGLKELAKPAPVALPAPAPTPIEPEPFLSSFSTRPRSKSSK